MLLKLTFGGKRGNLMCWSCRNNHTWPNKEKWEAFADSNGIILSYWGGAKSQIFRLHHCWGSRAHTCTPRCQIAKVHPRQVCNSDHMVITSLVSVPLTMHPALDPASLNIQDVLVAHERCISDLIIEADCKLNLELSAAMEVHTWVFSHCWLAKPSPLTRQSKNCFFFKNSMMFEATLHL